MPQAVCRLPSHASRKDGRCCKRIRGKVHYFIGTWEEALEKYNREKDYLQLGKEPPIDTDAVTARDVVNEFLTINDHLVASDELKQRPFAEYKKSCERVVRVLGKNRLAGDVGPDDFARIRPDKLHPCDAVQDVPGTRRR